MNIKLLLIIFFLLLDLTIVFAQDIIYISSLENDDYSLYELNIGDCSLTYVTKIEASVFDITFHPNGNLYGIDYEGSLWEINTITGNVMLINTFPNSNELDVFNSMTSDNEGVIYVTGKSGDLYSYNIQTGEEIFHGTMPFAPSGDLTFYNGKLYVAAIGITDLIIEVDISTPAKSEAIISQDLTGNIYGIVSHAEDCSDVKTYAMSIEDDLTSIYQIDFETKTFDFICNINNAIGGGASTFEFLGSVAIDIDDVLTTFPSSCLEMDGSIEVEASGGLGQLQYSINGTDFQSSGQFNNLLADNYRLSVIDENNCITAEEIDLTFPLLVIEDVLIDDSECDEEQRGFSIQLGEHPGPFNITLNDSISQPTLFFQDIEEGTYHILITDEFGCEIDTSIVINRKYCSIYIPNAFSPNRDGYNDEFKIYPHPLFEGEILSFYIFDRWGNTVYGKDNYDFETDAWDGSLNGKRLNPSVFVYMIKVDFRDGVVKTLSGDVTLVD